MDKFDNHRSTQENELEKKRRGKKAQQGKSRPENKTKKENKKRNIAWSVVPGTRTKKLEKKETSPSFVTPQQ